MISEPPEVDTSEDRPAPKPKPGQPQEARDRQPQDRQPRDRQPEVKPQAAPPDEHSGDGTGGGGKHRWWLWVLALLALAVAIYLLVHHNSKAKAQSAEGGASGASEAGGAAGKGGKGGKGNGPVPVLTATARTKDMGVYLNGLGTVVSLNTVVVKSRVDGQLLRINFREGQLVRAGDVLAEIDPRPFQVQLMQAQGQKSKDVAALQNAKVDLARYQTLIQSDSIPRQQLDTQAAMVAQIQASIESDQAAIESAKLNLTYARITAPTGGRIGLRQMDLGNIVHAADPTGLVTITQLQPIDVVFTLPADQLPQVVPQVHGGKRPPRRRLRSRPQSQARGRPAPRGRQRDRPDDWDRQAEGALPQHGRGALPQPVRQRPAARQHAQEHRHRPQRGGPAEPPGDFRLCRQAGQDGRGEKRRRPADRGGRHVDRQGSCGRRAGRHRRHRQTAAGRQGPTHIAERRSRRS